MKIPSTLILLALATSSISSFASDQVQDHQNIIPSFMKIKTEKVKSDHDESEEKVQVGSKRSSSQAFKKSGNQQKKEKIEQGRHVFKKIKKEKIEKEENHDIFQEIVESSKYKDEQKRQDEAIMPLYHFIANPQTQFAAENIVTNLAQSDIDEQRATAREVVIKLINPEQEEHLQQIGRILVQTFCSSKNRNERNTVGAIFLLSGWGSIPYLGERLTCLAKSDDKNERIVATNVLGNSIENENASAMSIFERMAKSDDKNEHIVATNVLGGALQNGNAWAIPVFKRLAKSEDKNERIVAAEVLERSIARCLDWVEPELLRLAKSDDKNERLVAANALCGALQNNNPLAIDVIERLAKSDDKNERLVATYALSGAIKKKSKSAHFMLNQLVKIKDKNIHLFVASVLHKSMPCDNDWAKTVIESLAKSEDENQRIVFAHLIKVSFHATDCWAKHSFQDFLKSEDSITKASYRDTNCWAKHAFRDFAKSEDKNERFIAIHALYYACNEGKDWAKAELARLAKSNNLNDRIVATQVISSTIANDINWINKEVQRLQTGSQEEKQTVALSGINLIDKENPKGKTILTTPFIQSLTDADFLHFNTVYITSLASRYEEGTQERKILDYLTHRAQAAKALLS